MMGRRRRLRCQIFTESGSNRHLNNTFSFSLGFLFLKANKEYEYESDNIKTRGSCISQENRSFVAHIL